MLSEVNDVSSDESEILEMRRRYEYEYFVQPNVKAIIRYRKQYSRLLANTAYTNNLCGLSHEIQHYFDTNRQTAEQYQGKKEVVEKIRIVIKKYRNWRFELFPFGSTVSGLASKECDLDLTVWCPDAQNFFSDDAEASFNILRLIRHFLFVDPEIRDQIESMLYVEAKVPLLKINFKRGVNVDLSCCIQHYVSGVHNSYLLRGYALWDIRFAPLCMVIKEWATRNGVKNPNQGGFNSYALVLLVIHLLQCVACPPILPNLQELFPRKYARIMDGELQCPTVLNFNDGGLPDNRPMADDNDLSLAELLLLFFDYYSNFDFKRDYICMRDAAVKPRNGGEGRRVIDRRISVFIRDPVDGFNPGRTVRDVKCLQDKMRRTLDLLTTTKQFPTLSQILNFP